MNFAFAIQLGFGGNSISWSVVDSLREDGGQQLQAKRIGILALGQPRPIEFREKTKQIYIITKREANKKKLSLYAKHRRYEIAIRFLTERYVLSSGSVLVLEEEDFSGNEFRIPKCPDLPGL